MKRNNKGNAAWRALSTKDRLSSSTKKRLRLRLAPEDVYIQRDSGIAFHGSRQGRGPNKAQ